MPTRSSTLWLKKLAVSLLSLLISLLAAELLIRAAGAAPEVSVIRKGRFQLSRADESPGTPVRKRPDQ